MTGPKGLYLFGVAACIGALSTFYLFIPQGGNATSPMNFGEFVAREEPAPTFLFLGDIMLGRHVEETMDQNGPASIFSGVADTLKKYQYVVANFEGSIPEKHEKTPYNDLKLSVRADLAETLGSFGITNVGLANNHTFDFGEAGYDHTKTILRASGLTVMGDPRHTLPEDVSYITYGRWKKKTIALIPVHATMGVDQAELDATIKDAESRSDMQIVFIHWGTEYERSASTYQRELGHHMVDIGVDAIIGHHPHVTETVEQYRGVPIFYSLGNFVFDQYWNNDVQTELGVALTFNGGVPSYELLPVRSEKSVPSFLQGDERQAALDDIALHSEENDRAAIKEGTITPGSSQLASAHQ